MVSGLTEYYAFTDKEEHIYLYSSESGITKLLSTCERSESFYILVEHDVLYNTFYHETKFEFWDATKRYNLDYLGYNNYEELCTELIKYLNSRILATSNRLLKAKYNHILWESSLSNRFQFGRSAIDCYLSYLIDWGSNDYDDQKANHIFDYFKYLKSLCISLNYRNDEYNGLLKTIINNASSYPGWFMHYIIELQFESRKVFNVEFNTFCFKYLETVFNLESGSVLETTYDLAIRYGQYLNLPFLNFHNLIAEYYYKSALKRNQDKHDFLIPQFYAKAIYYYKLAKNEEMLSKLNKEFNSIKAKHELPVVKFGHEWGEDISIMFTQCKNSVQEHLNLSNTSGMINFIASDKILIPNNLMGNTVPKSDFLNFCSTSSYDINNNFKQSKNKQIINPFTFYLQLFTIPYLHLFFKNAIETNKVSSDILINHLQNNTWLGTTKEGKSWLELLIPGINSFFSVYEQYLSNPKIESSEYVLAIDSLATKMEGILRTFAQLNDINTTKIEDDKKGEFETREIYLTELVSPNYPKFENLFDPNEYRFLKTVFLKDGYDIRNNIAHSFYKMSDYSMEKLLLIILSLMRISKYSVSNNQI